MKWMAKKCKQRVEFGDDYIAIHDCKGEVVMWNQSEWEDDSNVVFSIANAVKMASEGKSVRKLIWR